MTLAKNDVKEHTLYLVSPVGNGWASRHQLHRWGAERNMTCRLPGFLGTKPMENPIPQKMKMRLIEKDQGILLSFFGEGAITLQSYTRGFQGFKCTLKTVEARNPLDDGEFNSHVERM